MERFAFSLDEDAKAWLQDQSDELNISRAELLRRLIADARESDTPVIHGDTPSDSRVNHRDTDSDTVGDTDGRSDTPSDTVAEHGERLADLEARVEALEERFDTPEPDTERDGRRGVSESAERGATASSAGETGNVSDETPDTEAVRAAVREAIGDGPPRKSHAREALVDAVALLADRGALATGDLKAELYPRYEAEYSTKRTMWNSLDRHLGEVPGVHKPEYGTWAVDTEALLET